MNARAERRCACGCGQTFWPTTNQRYLPECATRISQERREGRCVGVISEERKPYRNGQSKLSDEAVVALREERSTGASISALAEKYGLMPRSVRRICAGETYAYLKGPRTRSATPAAERDAQSTPPERPEPDEDAAPLEPRRWPVKGAKIAPGANPTPLDRAIGVREVGAERAVDCPSYNDCLKVAINWSNFTCSACPLKK